MVEKLVLGSFIKKLKLSISLDPQSEMLLDLFLLYAQVKVCQNTLKEGADHTKLFKKTNTS